jgi:hypothetical protein
MALICKIKPEHVDIQEGAHEFGGRAYKQGACMGGRRRAWVEGGVHGWKEAYKLGGCIRPRARMSEGGRIQLKGGGTHRLEGHTLVEGGYARKPQGTYGSSRVHTQVPWCILKL